MQSEIRRVIDSLKSDSLINEQKLDQLPCPAMLINQERIVVETNQQAKEMGIQIGHYCWDTFGQRASIPDEDKKIFEETGMPPAGGTKCVFCYADQALESGADQIENIAVGETEFETYWIPVGENNYVHFGIPTG